MAQLVGSVCLTSIRTKPQNLRKKLGMVACDSTAGETETGRCWESLMASLASLAGCVVNMIAWEEYLRYINLYTFTYNIPT